MKSNSLFLALVMAGGLFSSLSQAETIVGTTKLQAIFTSEILPGTCDARVTQAGAETDTVNFGDLFKGEVGTRTEPFNIELTGCTGVKTTTVAAQPGSGSSCSGEAYATTGGTNTAVEIWGNAADTGTKLSCIAGDMSPVLTNTFANRAVGQNYTYPMVARWVVANGKTATDIKSGEAQSLITFLVTYQ
ncbi:fimbrial protein StaE [Salmonella enterica]